METCSNNFSFNEKTPVSAAKFKSFGSVNVLLQIQLADITSEKHRIQEHLRTSLEQHQRVQSTYQQKLAALQEECSTAKVFSCGGGIPSPKEWLLYENVQ